MIKFLVIFILIDSYLSNELDNVDNSRYSCNIDNIWIQDINIDFNKNTKEYRISLEKYTPNLSIFVEVPYIYKDFSNNKILKNRSALSDRSIISKKGTDHLGKANNFILDLQNELDVKKCNIKLLLNKKYVERTEYNYWNLDINNLSSINIKIQLENDIGKLLNEYNVNVINDKYKNIPFIDSVSLFDDSNVALKIEPIFRSDVYRYKIIVDPLKNKNIKMAIKSKYDVYINDMKKNEMVFNMSNDEFQKIMKVLTVNNKYKSKTLSQSYYFHFVNYNEDIKPPKSIIMVETGSPCLLNESSAIYSYKCYGNDDTHSFLINYNPKFLYSIKSENKSYIFSNTTTKRINSNDIEFEIHNGIEKKTYKIHVYSDGNQYIKFKSLPLLYKVFIYLFLLSALIQFVLPIVLSRNYYGINYLSHVFNAIVAFEYFGKLSGGRTNTHSSSLHIIYSWFVHVNTGDPFSIESSAKLVWSYSFIIFLFRFSRFLLTKISKIYNSANLYNFVFIDNNIISAGYFDWPFTNLFLMPLLSSTYTILHDTFTFKDISGDNLLFSIVERVSNARIRFPSVTARVKWILFETNVPIVCVTILILCYILYKYYKYYRSCYSAVKNGYLLWRWDDPSNDMCDSGYWSDRYCNKIYTDKGAGWARSQDFCSTIEVLDLNKVDEINQHKNKKPDWYNRQDSENVDVNLASTNYYDLVYTLDTKINNEIEIVDNTPACVKIKKTLYSSLINRNLGIIKCDWIDFIINCRFLKDIDSEDIDKSKIKLLVKMSQLHGPLANGKFRPALNGIRIPFIFFEAFYQRCLMGLLFGVINSSSTVFAKRCLTLSIAILYCVMILKIIRLKPYNNRKDNVIVMGLIVVELMLAVSTLLNLYRFLSYSNLLSAVALYLILLGVVAVTLYNSVVIYHSVVPKKSKLESYCNCLVSVEFSGANRYTTIQAYSKVPIHSLKIITDRNGGVFISPVITDKPVIAISDAELHSFINNNKSLQIPEIIIFYGNQNRMIIYKDPDKKGVTEHLKSLGEYAHLANVINSKIMEYKEKHVAKGAIVSITLD